MDADRRSHCRFAVGTAVEVTAALCDSMKAMW